MKLDDLKCEFCDGAGEREINVDGMDCPQACSFCNETGIDEEQLKKLMCEKSDPNANEFLKLHGFKMNEDNVKLMSTLLSVYSKQFKDESDHLKEACKKAIEILQDHYTETNGFEYSAIDILKKAINQ